MHTVNERLKAISARHFSPTTALLIAVPVGAAATYVLTQGLEALFSVHWWTTVIHMAVFFGVTLRLFAHLSPRGVRLVVSKFRSYLEESGAATLLAFARGSSSKQVTNS